MSYLTITLHLAFLFPSFVITVIVHFPFFLALTIPFLETVATFGLELFHLTALFVALLGVII